MPTRGSYFSCFLDSKWKVLSLLVGYCLLASISIILASGRTAAMGEKIPPRRRKFDRTAVRCHNPYDSFGAAEVPGVR